MSTAFGGLSGHLEHHLAADLGSPGSPKRGLLLPQRHILLSRYTTAAGLPGQALHHLASLIEVLPWGPKTGRACPHWQELEPIIDACSWLPMARRLLDSELPSIALALPSVHCDGGPRSLRLRAGSSRCGGVSSQLLIALRSLDLVGARQVGHMPLQ